MNCRRNGTETRKTIATDSVTMMEFGRAVGTVRNNARAFRLATEITSLWDSIVQPQRDLLAWFLAYDGHVRIVLLFWLLALAEFLHR